MGHPLDHIRQHLELTPEQEESLKSIMKTQKFRKGDTITGVTDMRSNAFYIADGSARVYYLKGGKEQTFSFAFTDEFVNLSYHLSNTPDSQQTIEFLEPTVAVSIPIADIKTMMMEFSKEHNSETIPLVITALLELTQSLEERLMVFQSASATERYKWLIMRYPKVLERATITQIASFLGVTKETLYRIRAGKYK